jgi:hypothetical protein
MAQRVSTRRKKAENMTFRQIIMTGIFLFTMSIPLLAEADFKIVNVEKCSRGNETKYTVVCDPASGQCVYVYQIDHTFKYVNHHCDASGYCRNLDQAIENAINCVNN